MPTLKIAAQMDPIDRIDIKGDSDFRDPLGSAKARAMTFFITRRPISRCMAISFWRAGTHSK